MPTLHILILWRFGDIQDPIFRLSPIIRLGCDGFYIYLGLIQFIDLPAIIGGALSVLTARRSAIPGLLCIHEV